MDHFQSVTVIKGIIAYGLQLRRKLDPGQLAALCKSMMVNLLQRRRKRNVLYLLACKKLGADPTKCVAVEDSRNGIISASRAGMMPFLVPDIIEPDEEMKQLAFKQFNDLLEVKEYLEA